jgi:hypothetical protein
MQLTLVFWVFVLALAVREFGQLGWSALRKAAPATTAVVLILVSFAITYGSWYAISNLAYIMHTAHQGAGVMFLTPRHVGRMNDMYTCVFSDWVLLFTVLPVLWILVYVLHRLAVSERLRDARFMFAVFVSALLVELLFLFFTPNQLHHVALQAKSLNNGGWSAMTLLEQQNPSYWAIVQRMFRELSANDAPYTIPGTTHPAGLFAVGIPLFRLCHWIGRELIGGTVDTAATTWGVIVALLGTANIPIIMIVTGELHGRIAARLSGVMMLAVPSVCIHFCALFDTVTSTMIGGGILLLLRVLKRSWSPQPIHWAKFLVYGLWVGFLFTLVAQITFGHAVPIAACLLSFALFVNRAKRPQLGAFAGGLAVFPFAYFIFERIVSEGKLFYTTRALNITRMLGHGLDASRPMPTAQIANFLVVFVMAGFLFLPALLRAIGMVFGHGEWILKGIRGTPGARVPEKFVIVAMFMMFAFLAQQQEVRLETERIWHWFMVPGWMLMGTFLIGTDQAVARAFAMNHASARRGMGSLVLILSQMAWSIMLAITIHDYY